MSGAVRYAADETRVPQVMERERHAARVQGVHAMAERVSRATGQTVTVENTGGHTMVARVRAGYGIILAFHVEGYAMFESLAAWHGDDTDPMVTDAGTPWEIVAEVTSWWRALEAWSRS